MFIPRRSESGPDEGKWYMMVAETKSQARRIGYCAAGCTGHETAEGAIEHYLQYQLDRESALWIDRRGTPLKCEICGELTTLRARLGRASKPFVLCTHHQSSSSLRELFRRNAARLAEPDA